MNAGDVDDREGANERLREFTAPALVAQLVNEAEVFQRSASPKLPSPFLE